VPVIVGAVRLFEWLFRHSKPFPIGPRLRWAIAVVGVVVAQFLTYREADKERTNLSLQKTKLETQLRLKSQALDKANDDLRELRSRVPKVIDRDGRGDAAKRIEAQTVEIRAQLSGFVKRGIELRNGWSKTLGEAENIQRPNAEAVQAWHASLEKYVATIPRGDIYVVRFQIPPQTGGSVPIGMNVNLSGFWELIASDLGHLNELISDPNLGKP
jgi:hypothetical protein